MKQSRALCVLCLCVLILSGTAFARAFGKGQIVCDELPPVRPQTIPAFSAPFPGEFSGNSLDEPWQFIQYLYDADTTLPRWQDTLNAVPVQFASVHPNSVLLATLHTVFETGDGGHSWFNLDPSPPPSPHYSDWFVMRIPMYISSLVARPVNRLTAAADTLLISAYSGNADSSTVRHLYTLGIHRLYPSRDFLAPLWLTCVAIPDSVSAVAIGGMDARLWKNDTLRYSFDWREVNTDTAFVRSGREDSLTPGHTWVSACTSIGQRILAVGSHHWISDDGGHRWHIRPAADSLFDSSVSFCDSLHGLTGGAMTSPYSHGWIHVTSDGGHTWSGRTLNSPYPVRAVQMVTPLIGFAGGGNYNQASGRLWSTHDGGQTWTLDAQISAEIRAITAVRVSSAYVNVYAAGVFPDFRGGIWRTQLYLPDSSHALLVTEPDTLNFGVRIAGQPDTMSVMIRNIGSLADTVTGIAGAGNHFTPLWVTGDTVAVPPGQQIPLSVVFTSDTGGAFTRYLTIQNLHSGRVEIFCTASVPLSTPPQSRAAVPQSPTLTVWPNPGNASFEIRYDLAREGDVSVRVYDLNGRLVETLIDAHVSPGEHVRTWNASDHASGIYFVRLNAESNAVTRKVLLIK